jgi:hypothetical protein
MAGRSVIEAGTTPPHSQKQFNLGKLPERLRNFDVSGIALNGAVIRRREVLLWRRTPAPPQASG